MRGRSMWARAAAAAVLVVSGAGGAAARDAGMTVQTLADRAAVSDLLTHYYNNFGGGVEDKVG